MFNERNATIIGHITNKMKVVPHTQKALFGLKVLGQRDYGILQLAH